MKADASVKRDAVRVDVAISVGVSNEQVGNLHGQDHAFLPAAFYDLLIRFEAHASRSHIQDSSPSTS